MSVKKLKDRKDYEFETRMKRYIEAVNSGEKEMDIDYFLREWDDENARLAKRDGY